MRCISYLKLNYLSIWTKNVHTYKVLTKNTTYIHTYATRRKQEYSWSTLTQYKNKLYFCKISNILKKEIKLKKNKKNQSISNPQRFMLYEENAVK